MINIEKNSNFIGWFNIFVGGFLVEQVESRAKAIKVANKLCKSRNEKNFLFEGFPMSKGDK